VIKRTVEVSSLPMHLAVRDRQLLLLKKTDPPNALPALPPNLAASIPCEDIGIVVVDHRECSYSHHALAELVDAGATVVICGRDHAPAGILLPYVSHSETAWRLDAQVRLRPVLRKRLWTQIVRAKIVAQASLLPNATPERTRLLTLARTVRSGDPENFEAQAARAYWPVWIPELRTPDQPNGFVREPGIRGGGKPPNPMLDYGYAILRAAVARSLVGSGLLPALGLHHRHRANAFALADDMIEPLRPAVDARVRRLWRRGWRSVERTVKAELLDLLTLPTTTSTRLDNREPFTGPLMVALHRYTASLAACLSGETDSLAIPTFKVGLAEASSENWRDRGADHDGA
jgi:CRISP-associated protein Cas1